MNLIKWDEFNNTEKPALDLLQKLGYFYIDGRELTPFVDSPERSSLREVILFIRLIQKIKEFNPWINETNIKQVLRILTIPKTTSQIEINEQIWEYLTKPSVLFVEQDLGDGKGRRNHGVKLIDWETQGIMNFLLVINSRSTLPEVIEFRIL